MRFLSTTLALLLTLPAAGAAAASPDREAAYVAARQELQDLRKDEQRRRFRHHWLNVARRFDRISKDKGNPHACDAHFLGGSAHAELSQLSGLGEDREEGLARLAKVPRLCKGSRLADDALFLSAELVRGDDPAAARGHLGELLRRYPKGDMVRKARALLAELGGETPAAAPKAAVAAAKPAPKAAPRPAPKAEPKPVVAKARPEKAVAPAAVVDAADRALASATLTAERVLAALDHGADAARPEDVAHEEDLGKLAAADLDRARLQKLKELERSADELSLSMIAGLKVKRVVVDAGHGGHDTGAIGPSGVRESHVTLAIAKKLKRKLEGQGLEVILTREDDTFVPLEERTRIANDRRADLFISVHCNAARSRKLRGIETYTLNLSSDKYAMKLAARENATSTRAVGDLHLILADLATKANTDDSQRLARTVQSELVSSIQDRWGGKIRDLGHKEALFFVLVGAKMPAILVESSFLSNPDEEKLLASDAYRDEIASSIARGVKSFIGAREEIARAPGGVY